MTYAELTPRRGLRQCAAGARCSRPSEARPLDLVPPQAAATICRIDTRYSMPSEARTQDIVAPRRGVRQYVALTLVRGSVLDCVRTV